jgi:threonine/homoserine/homoserine lactone efflux protein
MNATAWLAFAGASALLAVTPGPGVFYIVTRTLAQGRAAGAASVAGVALGNLLNAVGASLGLAALLAVSSLAFTVVKLAGAAYLVWLGVRMLRGTPPKNERAGAEPHAADADAPADALPVRPAAWRVLREGVWVALLNPKTAIFFAAFLPQFMHADAAALPQALLLGTVFVAIAATSDMGYVLLASLLAPRLGRSGRAARWGRWAGGGALIALGIASATGGPRTAAH